MSENNMAELGFKRATSVDGSRLTKEQVQQLLKAIHPSRILQQDGHSHVSQQDVTAHLIRIFGFGNFDIEVLKCDLVFEIESTDKKTGEIRAGRYDVTYRGLIRLTIKDVYGERIASYENGSMGIAQNQSRGDAHDLAYKSAISLSIKRAAIALGDQFGLSLYNKGQREALVMGSIAYPSLVEKKEDIQEGVTKQESLGNDEVEKEAESESEKNPDKVAAPKVKVGTTSGALDIKEAEKILKGVVPKILEATDLNVLRENWNNMKELNLLDSKVKVGTEDYLVRDVIVNRQKELVAATETSSEPKKVSDEE